MLYEVITFALLVGAMPVVGTSRGELSQFVTNHILGHENRDEFLAVVNGKRMTDKLGNDGGTPGPGFDHLLGGGAPRITSYNVCYTKLLRAATTCPSSPAAP